MTPEQKAAYIQAQVACAMARIAGMQAENQHRASVGESVAYGQEAFEKVSEDFGIYHNAVIGFFNNS